MTEWRSRQDPVSVVVEARNPLNPSGVLVEPGNSYGVCDISIDKPLSDGGIEIPTANGLRSHEAPKILSKIIWQISVWMRRVPNANWFELIALIEETGETFRIAKEASFKPKGGGRLYFFVNDVPFAYRNNKGRLSLTVVRENASGAKD